MTVFSFPYLEGKAKDGTSVFRPWVRIHLQGADDNWSAFQLYADAGARNEVERLYPRYYAFETDGLSDTWLSIGDGRNTINERRV